MFGLVQAELEQMKSWGIIKDSRSPRRNPMAIVPKPDGTVWLCIDFRKVNALSAFDAFPMPHIQEMLKKIG